MKPGVTGILLAGGLSKRMGQEKGELKLGNRKLAEYPLEVLEKLCDRILISTCRPSGLFHGHPSVCDEFRGVGPMAGILACLERSTTDLNLVVSYDMPLIRAELLELLLRENRGYDVVLPALHPQRPEPLCGFYRKSAASVIRKMIREKEYAVHRIRSNTSSKLVLIDERYAFFHPGLFMNINRKEDLLQLPPELFHD